MRALGAFDLETMAYNLIKQAIIYLPPDVKNALNKAAAQETNSVGRSQLSSILLNIALAEKQKVPLCQDTGTLIFYTKVGAEFKSLDLLENAIINATRRATIDLPLRPNSVNPFTSKNSDDNTGRLSPFIHWEITSGDSLEITLLVKGGGSENVSELGMLNPSEGLNGLKRFVIEAVLKSGARPCPPTILGIGVGGGADVALTLAKKALLKPIDVPNVEPELAQLENELVEAANMTGIGPMGLGGRSTVLGASVDYAFRHPASFPVAVVFSCWACRRASAKIDSNGAIRYFPSTIEE